MKKDFSFPIGNVFSGASARSGLAVLTAPTELARRKGNLVGKYPVTFAGVVYADAEAAYQANKNHFTPGAGWFVLMREVLIERFKQYPAILEAVRRSGGADFLAKCSHRVNSRKDRWQGDGLNSGYIRTLQSAYEIAVGE